MLLYTDIKAPLSQHPPNSDRRDTKSSDIDLIPKEPAFHHEVCTSDHVSPQGESVKRAIVHVVDGVQANDNGKECPCSKPGCRSRFSGLGCIGTSGVLIGFNGLIEA